MGLGGLSRNMTRGNNLIVNKENNIFKDEIGVKGLRFKLHGNNHGNHLKHYGNHHDNHCNHYGNHGNHHNNQGNHGNHRNHQL